jgi:hypothetical protein
MAVVIFQVMQCSAVGPIEILDSTHIKVGVGYDATEINGVVLKVVILLV